MKYIYIYIFQPIIHIDFLNKIWRIYNFRIAIPFISRVKIFFSTIQFKKKIVVVFEKHWIDIIERINIRAYLMIYNFKMKCKPITWSRERVFVCARGKDACHARVSSIASCRIMSCRVMSKHVWTIPIVHSLVEESNLTKFKRFVAPLVSLAESKLFYEIQIFTIERNQNINIYDYYYFFYLVCIVDTRIVYNLAFL